MSTCQAGILGEHIVNFFRLRMDEDWWEPCADIATWQVISGCVHEHVVTWDSCARCAAQLARQILDGKAAKCVECSALPGDQKHDCPVLVEAREYAGSSP